MDDFQHNHFEKISLWAAGKGTDRGMNELSSDELAFAFLLTSHKIFCRTLSGTVKQMMRDAYPETWIDEMCGCFSPAQASFVRKTLEEENEICDVFVLCKVLRSFMRRVLEPRLKVNKINLGPMEKERFLFQLQDVESSRHMAFHGEGVSVEEASLSLMSMKEFFSTLSGYQPTKPNQGLVQTCFSTHQKRLQVMTGILDYIIDESCQCSVWLPLQTIYGVLVYRCISTLESVMRTIPQDVNLSVFSACADKCPGGTAQLSELIRLMKKEASRPTQENKRKDYTTAKGHFNTHLIKVSKLFAGEASLRNRLDHGALLSKGDVHTVSSCTLKFLRSIDHKSIRVNLSDFDIDVDSFTFRQQPTEHLCSSSIEEQQLGMIIRIEPITRNAQLLFRSQCLVRDEPCIGREQEITICVKAIRDSCTPYRNSGNLSYNDINESINQVEMATRCVVITGPAGVGTSTLARNIVSHLQEDFKRQSWVCANTIDHFKNDLSSKVLSNRPKSKEYQDLETAKNFPMLPCGELIVLDNFRQEVAPYVSEALAYSPHVLIITAYTARALLPVRNGFRCLVQVSLSPFHTDQFAAREARAQNENGVFVEERPTLILPEACRHCRKRSGQLTPSRQFVRCVVATALQGESGRQGSWPVVRHRELDKNSPRIDEELGERGASEREFFSCKRANGNSQNGS